MGKLDTAKISGLKLSYNPKSVYCYQILIYLNGNIDSKRMIYTKIRKLRKARGITQLQMAEILHKSQNAYSMMECGKSKIDADILPVICRTFNISPNELFADDTTVANGSDEIRYREIIMMLKEELDRKNEIIKMLLHNVDAVEKLQEEKTNLIRLLNITKSYLSSDEVVN